MSDPLPRPWYRHLWPWLLMIPPGASVLGGIAMITLAIRTPHALVVDDYSRIAFTTEQNRSRDETAAAMGLSADVSLRRPGDGSYQVAARVALHPMPSPVPATLVLSLVHPTRAELDRQVVLAFDGVSYRGNLDQVPESRYYVHIEPEDAAWRLQGFIGSTSTGDPLHIAARPGR